MRRGTTRVLMMLALAAVLCLGLAASASAMPGQPVFTSVTPSTASNGSGSNYQLTIYGSNFSAISSVDAVRLQMPGIFGDTIYATNAQLNVMPGGGTITCNVSTAFETAGTYNVEIDWWNTLIGQLSPETGYIYGGFTVTQVAPPTPTHPQISSVSPTQATAGGPSFTLTVNGSNFATGSLPAVVKWNGAQLTQTSGPIVNPTAVLYATVPAALITTPGLALITVTNPLIGGGDTSVAANFAVVNAPPVLTGLAPATTWAKLITPPAVVLSGSGFVSGSTAVVNGVARAATFMSATQLSVQLTAADIATAASFTIAARNPQPGGGTSASLQFIVGADTTAPVTTISGADTAWHNTPVTLTVSATDAQSGVQKTMFGIGTTPPWTQLSGTSLTVPGPQGGNPNGANVVSAYSVDNCNNSETPPVQVTVNICTTGPTTEAFAPSSVTKGKKLKLGYQADSITPTCTITIKILKSNGSVAKTIKVGEKASNTRGNYSFACNLARGKYKVKVYAIDAAGNAQSSMSGDSFTVK